MRTLLVVVLLSALFACGGGEDEPRKPTTTERSDTSTYGKLAEETTCAGFLAMSEAEKLTTLENIDAVKNIDTPGSSLETKADVVTDVCELGGADIADSGLDTLLVNYQ